MKITTNLLDFVEFSFLINKVASFSIKSDKIRGPGQALPILSKKCKWVKAIFRKIVALSYEH